MRIAENECPIREILLGIRSHERGIRSREMAIHYSLIPKRI